MDRILAIGKKHGIPVVEDMAQSWAPAETARCPGASATSPPSASTPRKTSAALGRVAWCSRRTKSSAKKQGNSGSTAWGATPYQHEMIGINSRLDEIKACALVAKFPYLEGWNKKRIENARFYNKKMADLPVKVPAIEDDTSHIIHQYVMRVGERTNCRTSLKKKALPPEYTTRCPSTSRTASNTWATKKAICP